MNDLRYAFRQLVKTPAFTAVAVLTLTLGVGVNAAVFSFIRDMLLQPATRHHRLNLVSVHTSRADARQEYRSFRYEEFATLRADRDVFRDVTAFAFDLAPVGERGEFKRSLIGFVADNYFDVLGVRPYAGRFFTAEEADPRASAAVVVANHTFWKRLGSRSDFVGSRIEVNQQTFTVIGIAPAGFGGLHASIGPDVWLPLGALRSLRQTDVLQKDVHPLLLCANLLPGLGVSAAQAKAGVLDARLNALDPADDPRRLVLQRPSLFDLGNAHPSREDFLPLFAGLTLAVGTSVLLMACLNLANMLLARGTTRRKEIAVRLSLGASRLRVVRQLLAEGLVLALVGGLLGLWASVWFGDFMLAYAAASFAAGPFAMTTPPAVDVSLIVVSIGLSVVATLLFSLFPALQATRVDLLQDLKQQTGNPAGGDRWARFFSLRHSIVMLQMALAIMLLFCGGLFVRGFHAAVSRDAGFMASNQVVLNLDYEFTTLSKNAIRERQAQLLDRVQTMPQVTQTALASGVPFNFELPRRPVTRADTAVEPAAEASRGVDAGDTSITSGYFAIMGIPLVDGRDFDARESRIGDGRPVVIVDERLAQALFPEGGAVGRHLVMQREPTRPLEIVGVVRSSYNDVFDPVPPYRIYRPLAQAPESSVYVHCKVSDARAARDVIDAVRRNWATIEPATPLLSARPLVDYFDRNLNLLLVRMAATTFAVFGFVGLVLAVVGVYGLKAYAVERRTREIGIRLALGARQADVSQLILRQGVRQVAVAALVGVVFSLLAGGALSRMLYRVNPFDPVLLVAAVGIIAATAVAACWFPARRATRVNPMVALRND